MPPKIGGSFAPPLSDETLAGYRRRIDALPPRSQLRDLLDRLYACVAQWWDLPDSEGTPTRPHPAGRGLIVDLAPAHQQALWDAIPWDEELEAYARVLDRLPAGVRETGEEIRDLPDGRTYRRPKIEVADPAAKALRDAAFHLLWHVQELARDREPLTNDLL